MQSAKIQFLNNSSTTSCTKSLVILLFPESVKDLLTFIALLGRARAKPTEDLDAISSSGIVPYLGTG